jgi:hypothetical protein
VQGKERVVEVEEDLYGKVQQHNVPIGKKDFPAAIAIPRRPEARAACFEAVLV